ncbi:MAG: vWA domain-containing protein [Planctomycetota bacterium]
MKQTSILVLALLLLGGLAWTESGDEGSVLPLDLPSGHAVTDEEDDEDQSESIIFFGQEFEGQAFFFLLDKSGSMVGAKMASLKHELATSIQGLSRSSEFGMVAFSTGNLIYSPLPKKATASRKANAIAWVDALQPYGATFMLDGATALLPIASLSRKRHRVVIAVGDGLPNGPGADDTLQGILTANWENLPFNTILFGTQQAAIDFMSDLAAATGGSFSSNPD